MHKTEVEYHETRQRKLATVDTDTDQCLHIYLGIQFLLLTGTLSLLCYYYYIFYYFTTSIPYTEKTDILQTTL